MFQGSAPDPIFFEGRIRIRVEIIRVRNPVYNAVFEEEKTKLRLLILRRADAFAPLKHPSLHLRQYKLNKHFV